MALAMGGYSAAPSTATDNQTGNTYTAIGSDAVNGSVHGRMFYAKNVNASGTFTITCNTGVGGSGGTAFAREIAGADATTPFTVGESSTGSGALAGTHTTGSATNTTNANSICVGGFWNDDSSNPCGTMTWNNSWTKDVEETNAASFAAGSSGYKIVSASASQQESVTFTNTTGTAAWAAAFAIFQQSTGGGGGAAVQPVLMMTGVGP